MKVPDASDVFRGGVHLLAENPAVRWLVTETPISRSLVERFVAGDTLGDAIQAAHALNDSGFAVSLNQLGEEVSTREATKVAMGAAIESLERIAAEDIIGNVSVKPSQLGLRLDPALALENVERILLAARAAGGGHGETFVRLDMEASPYTERTIQLVEELWEFGYRNVGTVIQASLRRSIEDIQRLNDLGSRVRLVKGAYKEPPEVAYQSKAEVDRTYLRAMQLLLREGVYPAIATHDEVMIEATMSYAEEIGLGKDHFEFQMIYGVRRDLQQQVRDKGYNLRVYIPWGDSWYPYLMRRIAERPANLMFVVNSVLKESPLAGQAWPLALGAGVVAGVLGTVAWQRLGQAKG